MDHTAIMATMGAHPINTVKTKKEKKCEYFLVIVRKVLPLQRKTRKEHSSVGLERFSHIEEVIGSSPIVPTEKPSKDAWLFCLKKQLTV